MMAASRLSLAALLTISFLSPSALAQEPVGTLEGQISDPSSAAIAGADISAKNAQTGLVRTAESSRDGAFHFSNLPVGEYSLSVNAKGFTAFSASGIRIDIGRTVSYPVKLEVAGGHASVDVVAQTATVDTSQSIGVVVSGAQTQDLPLNGRDLTQLGLLQPGVAPMTAGLAQAGGIARSGQAFAVNGERPESNNYLLDGASNVDSVNGGYALRVPVDSVSEFRILTLNAPAEYGGTSGATTSVVTRSGSNALHGDAYDFLRNNAFDARNFFAATTEPLHRNQYGATLGGPIRKDKDFFFAYYEGQRDSEGKTQAAIVPTIAERTGDFSGLTDPATGKPAPLINYFAGRPYPNNMIPASQLNPIAIKAAQLYPAPNIGTNVFESTQIGTTDYDQGGFRLDHYFAGGRDQTFLRYSSSSLNNFDPLPISGAGVPGFPVVNDISTNGITISDVHISSPSTLQTFRASFLRNVFKKDQATNHTPGSSLGFGYQPTLALNQGTPYLIVSGYASLGNPITGPQDTWQNNYQGSYSIAMTRGRHNIKLGADLERQQINVLFGIATNGFFVFAPFPVSDSFGSFLTGQSVQFFQGGGQFDRGLRKWVTATYAQDEWRIRPNLTLNYGLRYEVNTPYTEIRDRLNAFVPGTQSKIYPNAPVGLLFPGDPGVPAGIAPVDYTELMPRVGITWDPTGDGKTAIRAGYGIFYDGFENGTGGPLQAAVSALPWTQAYQLPGPGFNIANPYGGGPTPFGVNTFVAPATILTVESGMKPPYSQNWNFGIERTIAKDYLLDVRYVGNKGTHLPRFIEDNPTVYTPGANPGNLPRRYSTCNAAGLCNYGSVGLLADNSSSTYHALQAAFSRQFASGLHFTASYWFSKSLDYISTLNVAGSAPSLVAGENDLAQNPNDLAAEHGPSLFDARHRFVLSGSYPFPQLKSASKALNFVANGWQVNTIATFSSGTPFTVYDSANVSLQGSAPEISGFYSSRPNLVSDPNANQPHTANQWIRRAPFQQLNPTTQAGQFGNEGRNVVRGPGIQNVDFSLFRNFAMGESRHLQFRAECFNLLNHANLGLPENDLQSPAFGQILQAAPPRLLQLALKFVF
ncbi:MAG TPA: carboxypeptidase regulatory-like domain-containing protein [Bryobacteraceae bacterium]|nr:carboxypeptidase regulatory-like domain-containing protein [Bryobacteraceae bacterium]